MEQRHSLSSFWGVGKVMWMAAQWQVATSLGVKGDAGLGSSSPSSGSRVVRGASVL